MVRERPVALVVDSIQTVFLEDATGSPGSVSQVRECATALLHAAKTADMPVFIIGHVTKSGDIAGPRVLEHIVDVVLYLEGDADRAVRVLRVRPDVLFSFKVSSSLLLSFFTPLHPYFILQSIIIMSQRSRVCAVVCHFFLKPHSV